MGRTPVGCWHVKRFPFLPMFMGKKGTKPKRSYQNKKGEVCYKIKREKMAIIIWPLMLGTVRKYWEMDVLSVHALGVVHLLRIIFSCMMEMIWNAFRNAASSHLVLFLHRRDVKGGKAASETPDTVLVLAPWNVLWFLPSKPLACCICWQDAHIAVSALEGKSECFPSVPDWSSVQH